MKYYPIHYGVACVGNITKREYTNGPTRREYSIWRNFIRRCYDPEDQDYKTYGALGVKVCDRWLCFENFYNDLPSIPGYNEWLNNKGKYDLDKDYLQQNIPHSQKVYSPTTCIFISKTNNNLQRAMDHSNTGYVGVYQLYNNSYTAFISPKSGTVNLGTYSSLEAAINARNRGIIKYYGNDTFLNNVYYMNFNEICDYYVGKNLEKTKDNLSIEMCKIVKKEMCTIVKDKNNNTH